MNQDHRVLQRIGARELTRDEMETITGGVRTLTICTVPNPTGFIGDETGPESC